MDCTNCWLPMNSCICGQRRPMLAGGVINPEDYYEGKGTKDDPLKGKNYKGFMAKHQKMGNDHLEKLKAKNGTLIAKMGSQLVSTSEFINDDEKYLSGVPGFLLGFLLQQSEFKVSKEFLNKYNIVFNTDDWRQNALANLNKKPLPYPNSANWNLIKANRTRINILRQLEECDKPTINFLKKKLKKNPLHDQI